MRNIFSRQYLASVAIIAKNAMRDQYKNSFMGVTWSFLQPAAYVIVLAVVFSTIMRFPTKDYIVYIMSGMVPWQFMLAAITRGASSIVTRRAVFHHSLLPKSMFIIADVLVQVYIFLITMAFAYVISLFFVGFHWQVLLLPLMAVPLIIFCLAGAWMFAYMSAYVWDIPPFLNIAFMVAFWTIPIAYPIEVVPEEKKIWFAYNPLYLLIHPIQQLMCKAQLPTIEGYGVALGVAGLTTLVAYFFFRKLHRNVIYYI